MPTMPHNHNQVNILIVEDDIEDAEYLEEILSDEIHFNYTMTQAKSLQEAEQALKEQKFDVMLLDLSLPESRGLETFTTVYNNLEPGIPIIVLSGNNDENLAYKTVHMGAQDYIPKGKLDAALVIRCIRYSIERFRIEEQLRESNRRLKKTLEELKQTQNNIIQQERLRALGRMTSGIAHDFNNALSSIVGFSQLLLTNPKTLDNKEKVKSYLEMIYTSARDSSQIIKRLSSFYRKQENTEDFQTLQLENLLKDCVLLTEPRWRQQAISAGKEIEILQEFQAKPIIQGNEAELRETVTNLIFNAVDAIPKRGTITLRLFETSGEENAQAIIEIADTGKGMREDEQAHCLEPFYTTKGKEGTGLGLAMVYGTVKRHNGNISIKSKVDEGTTFQISLPISKPTKLREEQQVYHVERSLNILLVEGDDRVRQFLSEYLSQEGHNLTLAANGLEGVEKFDPEQMDVVITSKSLAKLNGDRLAETVKKMTSHIPVVMLTGTGDFMQLKGEKPSGVDFIINKPVLITAINKVLVEIDKQWSQPQQARKRS